MKHQTIAPRNHTSLSSLKNRMSTNGEILYNSSALNSTQSWQGHNNFLGNTEDALSREPQTRSAPRSEGTVSFWLPTKSFKVKD